ncbi:hypothetical protein ACA910_002653 [Epithemia clementina (nom. ined.)]
MEKTTDPQGELEDRLMSVNEPRVPEPTWPQPASREDDQNQQNPFVQRMALTPYIKSSQCWELAICIAFFAVTFAVLEVPFQPRQRPIPYQVLENSGEYVRNLSIDETFEGETISSTLLLVLSTILPLALQEILSYGRLSAREMSYYDMHATLCAYLVAFSINSIVTDSVKLYVGYLRPIFYEMCQPDEGYSECMAENGGGNYIRKSFPSGHASFSFNGLTLLTLYIHSRFGMGQRTRDLRRQRRLAMIESSTSMGGERLVTDSNNNNNREMVEDASTLLEQTLDVQARIISLLSLLPMGLALFIATSRIVDNLHFPADVVGGAVVGASIASFIHGLWFGGEQ